MDASAKPAAKMKVANIDFTVVGFFGGLLKERRELNQEVPFNTIILLVKRTNLPFKALPLLARKITPLAGGFTGLF